MSLNFRTHLLCSLIILLGACVGKPKAEKREHIHEIHSHKRVDNYHWLKDPDRKDKDVLEHLKVENEYADSYLSSTEGLQETIYKEMIGRLKETDENVPYLKNGYYYYSRTEKGKDYAIYCRKKGSLDSKEQIILDMNIVSKKVENASLGGMAISPDQSILAYSIAAKGSEVYYLSFKDLDSGKHYIDKIENVDPGFVWAADNRTLFFVRHNKAFRRDKVFRYQLASNKENLIYEEKDELFDVFVGKTQDNKYLLMGAGSYTSDESYYLDAKKPSGQWRIVQKRKANLEYSVEHNNGYFYILNNDEAINFKISRTPVARSAQTHWKDFVKHDKEALLTGLHMQKERLVYSERREGLRKIRYVDFASKKRFELKFDEPVYQVYMTSNPEFDADHLRINFQSPITPPIVYDYNFSSGKYEVKKKKEVPNYDASKYETKRVNVKARDGEQVPVTLLYSKGFETNGKAPMLLYAYGSYGMTIDPRFSTAIFSLLDRGFIYAVAHIRGSQAKGRSWYEDGKILNKKNTFNDFVDVARGMIGSKYTSRDRLVIRGGSAGGLLMGAVVNQDPTLFKSVIAEVPFVDVLSTVLDPKLRFSTQEYQQWGNPNEKEFYDYILSYSPYDQVKEAAYPTIFAITGLYDTRVNYWEPAKWVAKLRELNTSSNTIIMKTQMDAGHGGSYGRYKAYKEEAEVYGFILKSTGPFHIRYRARF